tara:strand:- start:25 stop:276 length:252 start_codon:yes stop_codon:yes gene_type:complete
MFTVPQDELDGFVDLLEAGKFDPNELNEGLMEENPHLCDIILEFRDSELSKIKYPLGQGIAIGMRIMYQIIKRYVDNKDLQYD